MKKIFDDSVLWLTSVLRNIIENLNFMFNTAPMSVMKFIGRSKWLLVAGLVLGLTCYSGSQRIPPPDLSILPPRERAVLEGRTFECDGLQTIRAYLDEDGNCLTTKYEFTRSWFLMSRCSTYIEYQILRVEPKEDEQRVHAAMQSDALDSWTMTCNKRVVNSLFTWFFDVRSETTIDLTLCAEHLRPVTMPNNTQAITASVSRGTSVKPAGLHMKSTSDTIEFMNVLCSNEALGNGSGLQITSTGTLRIQKSAGLSMNQTRVHPTRFEELRSVTRSLLLGCQTCDLASQGVFPLWPTPIARTLTTQSLAALTGSVVLFNQETLLSWLASKTLPDITLSNFFRSFNTVISIRPSLLTEQAGIGLKSIMTAYIKLQLIVCSLIAVLTLTLASSSLNRMKQRLLLILADIRRKPLELSQQDLIQHLHYLAPFFAPVMKFCFETLDTLLKKSPFLTAQTYLSQCLGTDQSSPPISQGTSATTSASSAGPPPSGSSALSVVSPVVPPPSSGTTTSLLTAPATSGVLGADSPLVALEDSALATVLHLQQMAYSIVCCPDTCAPSLITQERVWSKMLDTHLIAAHSSRETMASWKEALLETILSDGLALTSKQNATLMLDWLDFAASSSQSEYELRVQTQPELSLRCMSLLESTHTLAGQFKEELSLARRLVTITSTTPAQ
jgi:hypothetical protein